MRTDRVVISLFLVATPLLIAQRSGSSGPSYGTFRDYPDVESKRSNNGKVSKSDPNFTLKVESQLVGVDVVALDASGAPVMDLKAGDLTVFEDGKERPLSAFSLEKRGVGNGGTLALLREATKNKPAAVSTNFDGKGELIPKNGCTILLVDLLNTSISDQAMARGEMKKFIANVNPDHPIALYVLGKNLYRLQDFTSDPARLQAAVETLASEWVPNQPASTWQGDHPLSSNPLPAPAVASSTASNQNQLANSIMRELDAEMVNVQTDARVEQTANSLMALSRRIAAYHGRKSLIWLSSTFPIEIMQSQTEVDGISQYASGTPRQYAYAIEELGRTMASADVAVYPVDARGLMSGAVDASMKGNESGHKESTAFYYESALAQISATISAPQRTMDLIADETGGRAFFNSNDIAGGMELALNDGSSFYSLSFKPASQSADGSFHAIKITSHRKGIHLRYRKGYYALDARNRDTLAKDMEKLLVEQALLDQHTLSTSLPLMAQVDAAHPNIIDLWVHGSSLSIISDTKTNKPTVRTQIAVVTFDEAGNVLSKSNVLVNTALRQENLNKVVNDGLSQNVKFERPAGAKRVRLAIRDIPSGRIGTIDVQLSVSTADALTTLQQK